MYAKRSKQFSIEAAYNEERETIQIYSYSSANPSKVETIDTPLLRKFQKIIWEILKIETSPEFLRHARTEEKKCVGEVTCDVTFSGKFLKYSGAGTCCKPDVYWGWSKERGRELRGGSDSQRLTYRSFRILGKYNIPLKRSYFLKSFNLMP